MAARAGVGRGAVYRRWRSKAEMVFATVDLGDDRDRAFAFDYDHSGRLDHVALYRPGSGTFWILRNTGGNFAPVYAAGDPGNGIGGYDLGDDRDRAFAFDCDHSGRLDHVALYRPGTGTMWILERQ